MSSAETPDDFVSSNEVGRELERSLNDMVCLVIISRKK